MGLMDIYNNWKIKRYYNKNSEGFNSITDTFQGWRTKDINDTHDYTIKVLGIEPQDLVLDAGCGVGGPLVYIAQKVGCEIEGITLSDVQYQMAGEKIGNLPNAKVYLGDFHKLRDFFPADYFTKVMFLESFCHTADATRLVRSAREVIKKDGLLYIRDLFINQAHSKADELKIRKAIKAANKLFVYNHLPLDTLLDIIKHNGFEVILVQQPQFVPFDITPEFEQKFGIKIPGEISYAISYEIVARAV